jgi:hypothetical protein
VFDNWAVMRKSDTIAVIAVKDDGDVEKKTSNIDYSPYFGGAALLYD